MAHILVVEDDELIAALERDFLEANGFVVTIARNGLGVQEVNDKVDVDALFVAVILPGKHCFTYCLNLLDKCDDSMSTVTQQWAHFY